MQIELRSPGRGATGPWRRKTVQRLSDAAARATDKAATGARDEIRSAMQGQRLGKLAKAIGATSDHKLKRRGIRGGRLIDAAGFVFARGKSARTRGALEAYVENDTTDIAPKNAKYLWIASPELQRLVGTGSRKRRLTPGNFATGGLEAKLGKLQFIPGRTAGTAYLVLEDVSIRLAAPGKLRGISKTGRVGKGRARVGIIAFTGIRRTRRQRRVAPRQIGARWQQQLSELLAQELDGRS